MADVKRLSTLDGLRGVAAASVVAFHYGKGGLLPVLLPNAPMAVDFFFILSGFVIAHVYGPALQTGLGWRGFAGRRMIRLYPLIALGTSLGMVSLGLRFCFDRETVDGWPQIVASALLNLAVLPMPFGGAASRFALFPGDTPMWSLFFEVAINLLWAAGLCRASRRGKLAMVLLSAGVVAIVVQDAGTIDLGFAKPSICGGAARVAFGFCAGLLLHDVAPLVCLPTLRTPTVTLGAVLLMVFAVDPAWFGPAAGVWTTFCLFVVLPAIVAIGAAQTRESRVDCALGDLSYPLYVLHAPLLVAAQEVVRFHLVATSGAAVAVLGLGVTGLVSVAALRFYDVPIRIALAAAMHSPRRRLAVLEETPA